MTKVEQYVEKRLFELQDKEYGEFQRRLMPTVEADTVIGVRVPKVRSLAKELNKTPMAAEFIKILPHRYYEENNLHAFLAELIPDYGECIKAIDEFLPFVDNWSTCDSMKPKVFKKHTAELAEKIKEWIASGQEYTVRFGTEMLMGFYLGEDFELWQPELVAAIRSDKYYVNMMTAWYFATALAKQYDAVIPFIEKRRLDTWTHNKAIQKSIESYRITDEQKAYLRSLKI